MKIWIHASANIDTKLYRGIWYGAKKNPITVKELLDKIIKCSGQGFNIITQSKHTSDNLLDDDVIDIYLIDEERRGRFKLDDESIQYLMHNLDECWLRDKLAQLV